MLSHPSAYNLVETVGTVRHAAWRGRRQGVTHRRRAGASIHASAAQLRRFAGADGFLAHNPSATVAPIMGRIIAAVSIANVLDASKQIRCDGLVDTGASTLVLPAAWRERLGTLEAIRAEVETADQRIVQADVCGPVRVQIEGFRPRTAPSPPTRTVPPRRRSLRTAPNADLGRGTTLSALPGAPGLLCRPMVQRLPALHVRGVLG